MGFSGKRYTAEMIAAVTAYAVVLVVSIRMLQHGIQGPLRYTVALLPMLPLLLVPFVVVRSLQRMDELQKRIQLEALAFGFTASALLTFGYGFLQGVGLPQVNWCFVWPVMAVCWIVGQMLASRRYR